MKFFCTIYFFRSLMNWNDQYDVVVVGTGAGGIVSAITAANKGLKLY